MPPKSTPTTIETETYLQTANDWEKWFMRLQELAIRKDVWEYFNPDAEGPALKRPTPPTVDRMVEKINKTRMDEYQTQLQIWEEAESDEEGLEPQRPQPITDLTSQQLKNLDQQRNDYKILLEEYKIINTAHEYVRDWIDKTVDASWRRLATRGSTAREVVQALRRNVSQTNNQVIASVSQTYIRTLKTAEKLMDPVE